jgi:hypothetical protein
MADSPEMAHVTDLADAADMRRLAEHCGDLKKLVVAFAQSARFDRWRGQELAKAAGDGEEAGSFSGSALDVGSERWIQAMDDFIMTFRFPDDTGVIDRFLAARGKELRKSDRKIIEGWRDPVDGIFELRAKSVDSLTLYNLIDELEYLTYGNMGFNQLSAEHGDFVLARLVPMTPGVWTVSGTVSPFPREHAKVVAQLALEWMGSRPRAAFRNPEKMEQGWEMMREDRDEFVEFFGSDQVILPAGEAEGRVNAYYRQRQEKALAKGAGDRPPAEVTAGVDRPFFAFPEELLTLDTIGAIYDETDGLSLLPDFGTLEELFADPALLAADSRYAEALLGYLDSDSIYPSTLRFLAAAHPDTVDEVYRRVLRKPTFTWAKNGELLLRRRKPWYFKRPPYPKVTPTSEYLVELLSS